nr:YfcE family phosphodiesterase [Dissulfurirhabdus thermomarina]
MSDTHDHVWNVRAAVAQARRLGAEVLLHCGDLVSPFVLEELDAFPGPVHLVLGNNAGDQLLLARHCQARGGRVVHHGAFGRIEAPGGPVAWVHDPDWGRALARAGEHRLVCFGHTHRFLLEEAGGVHLLNPGELLGRKEPPGWALVDGRDFSVTRVLLEGGRG